MTLPPDIFDHEPNIGSSTPEPTLRRIIFLYYNAHFGITESKGLTEDYIKELTARGAPRHE